MRTTLQEIFTTPVSSYRKKIIILVVAAAFLFFPQQEPIDWVLNAEHFWSDVAHPYANPDVVYPPWGLILMLPYQWMQAAGARFLSVVVIGWLVIQQKWSLLTFFSIVISPYFFTTMSKSSIDIFVFVLPVLLWRSARGSRWQGIGWGVALSLLLLKPQGAVLIWLYLLWSARRRLKDLLLPLAVVALVILPVSLLGSPPLILQWVRNIANPSPQNQFFWGLNNISLTHQFSFPAAASIVCAAALGLLLLARARRIAWTENHTVAACLFTAMFLSPYASQQSVSSALAFIPSWAAVAVQVVGIVFAFYNNLFFGYIATWVLLFAVCSMILFGEQKKTAAISPQQA